MRWRAPIQPTGRIAARVAHRDLTDRPRGNVEGTSLSIASFVASPSGVVVADDFRDNLIIDRHDPVFATMRASKIKHLRSENSEDAVTWNVFRSLGQIRPAAWFPALASVGLAGVCLLADDSIIVQLWRSVSPPPGLLRDGDEGNSEIDVIVESPNWVWFIEAKYRSDISLGTTTRPDRNQILRNIDVGSYYAGVRDFYFSLLVSNEKVSPVGYETVKLYKDLKFPRRALSRHRPDGLQNLQEVSVLTWADLAEVLTIAKGAAHRSDEQGYAERAIAWLREKGIPNGRGH